MIPVPVLVLGVLYTVRGAIHGPKEWLPAGNGTIPLCHSKEDIGISLTEVWTYVHDDDSQGCEDCRGNTYQANESITVCGGCLRYTCEATMCEDPIKGELTWVTKYFWSQPEQHSVCCTDFQGHVLAPGGEIGCRSLGDECKTKECLTCKTKPGDHEKDIPPTGYLLSSFRVSGCCLDHEAFHPVGKNRVDAEFCSIKVCKEGHPAYWETLEHYGTRGCCIHNDMMLTPEQRIKDDEGDCLCCCEGKMIKCGCDHVIEANSVNPAMEWVKSKK